jgi:hypothetical protein
MMKCCFYRILLSCSGRKLIIFSWYNVMACMRGIKNRFKLFISWNNHELTLWALFEKFCSAFWNFWGYISVWKRSNENSFSSKCQDIWDVIDCNLDVVDYDVCSFDTITVVTTFGLKLWSVVFKFNDFFFFFFGKRGRGRLTHVVDLTICQR